MEQHSFESGSKSLDNQRSRYDVAEIFRAHGREFQAHHAVSSARAKVMRAIQCCRTVVLGGHVDICSSCGHEEISYNSCRDRHCPKCQCLAQARWLERRKERLLPVPYFHVVFTLPAQLRSIAARHPRTSDNLLFEAASSTLRDLGHDPKWLGGTIGVTAVLHTWTRELKFHPHLHCVVTAGALDIENSAWNHGSERYLFPVQAMSELFRGRFIEGLERAWRSREVELDDPSPDAFQRLRQTLFAKPWVVFSKRPFSGPESVYTCLGQYTHRVAISNRRLLHVDDSEIRIATRNGGSASMPPVEFIRRFLDHVLPPRFFEIRHDGLIASTNVPTRLETARQLLIRGLDTQTPRTLEDWRAALLRLTGIDLRRCRACTDGEMKPAVPRRLPRLGTIPRAPPNAS